VAFDAATGIAVDAPVFTAGAFTATAGTVAASQNLGSAGAPLGTAVVTAPGGISLQDVITAGDQTFTGPTTLNSTYATGGGDWTVVGNVTLGSAALVDTTGALPSGDVAITGTINGANPLTVTAGDRLVTFGGDIGGTDPLASLTVTTAGDVEFSSAVATTGDVALGTDLAVIPDVAKIYKRTAGDLTIVTGGGDFIMGQHGKLTVVEGNLLVDTRHPTDPALDGDLIVGDLSVGGNIEVLARNGTIRVLRRAGGPLRLADGVTVALDAGVDIVAGGTITFASDVVAEGTGSDPVFGSPVAGGVTGVGAFSILKMPSAPTLKTPEGTALDAAAAGVRQIDIADALAGAAPKATQAEVVTQEITLNPALRVLLEQLGVFARELTPEEQAEFGTAATMTFDDIIRKPEEEVGPEDYTVAASRLPNPLVEQAVDTWREIFWKGDQYLAEPIKGLLQKAFDAYKAKVEGKVDPLGFRKYLETTPEQAEALKLINNLRRLFGQVSYLGLTKAQQRYSEGLLVGDIVPDGMTAEQLIKTIRGL
jgi:hypothetical protein